jgi:S1-C subfamily serine protease
MKEMRRTIFAVGFVSALTGTVLGAAVVMSVGSRSQNRNQDNVELQTAESTGIFQPVAEELTEETELQVGCDLTAASDIAVESVVHVSNNFVTEQVVYDPWLRLFYGEEAYKIRERRGVATGSGVIVSPEGHIVTNNHVVAHAEKLEVSVGDSKYAATLIGADPSTDLAVIKIEKSGLPYLEFGNSDDLKLGEWVIAVGNPLNLQSTVTAGIVSAKNRNLDLLTSSYNPEEGVFPVESFIQTDAAVNSGNSGGALVNQSGELVGINTAIASGTGYYAGYSFAVPSNIVKKVAYDLIKYGEVKRVQLGVNILDNNKDIATQNALSTDDGILVTGIVEGGNASKSDLKENDVILAVEGMPVNSVAELKGKIALYKPGDIIKLTVQRSETKKDIIVTMD